MIGMYLTQGQYDFLMSYWVLAINAVMAAEKDRKTANKRLKQITDKVQEEGLYEHSTKSTLERQYHMLFRYKSPFLYKTIDSLKRLKHRLSKRKGV